MREHLQSKPGYNRACKTPQKWIGSAKTTETSAGNTTFYKYKILASAAKFVIFSLSLSLSLSLYLSLSLSISFSLTLSVMLGSA